MNKSTLTLLTALLLVPLAALHASDAAETPAGAAAVAGRVAYLYQPTEGVIADVIPYYWQERFHLMHLQRRQGRLPAVRGCRRTASRLGSP